MPIERSRKSNFSKVRVLTRAILSNSSCIFLSTLSVILPAPALATSTAAPMARPERSPCGDNFRTAKTRAPHTASELFATLLLVSLGSLNSLHRFSCPFLKICSTIFAVQCQHRRPFEVWKCLFFSTAFIIRRTRLIRNKSKNIHMNKNNNSIAEPVFETSLHFCQPSGSLVSRTK